MRNGGILFWPRFWPLEGYIYQSRNEGGATREKAIKDLYEANFISRKKVGGPIGKLILPGSQIWWQDIGSEPSMGKRKTLLGENQHTIPEREAFANEERGGWLNN